MNDLFPNEIYKIYFLRQTKQTQMRNSSENKNPSERKCKGWFVRVLIELLVWVKKRFLDVYQFKSLFAQNFRRWHLWYILCCRAHITHQSNPFILLVLLEKADETNKQIYFVRKVNKETTWVSPQQYIFSLFLGQRATGSTM